MQHALQALNLPPPVDFAAGAEPGTSDSSKARYVLFAEFSGDPTVDEPKLSAEFDKSLQEQNRVYREHRHNGVAILPTRFARLPRGSVTRFLRDCRKNNVQAKFPRIVDDCEKAVLERYSREAQ